MKPRVLIKLASMKAAMKTCSSKLLDLDPHVRGLSSAAFMIARSHCIRKVYVD